MSKVKVDINTGELTAPRIRNASNYFASAYRGKVITQPSMTVPDQAFSMKEILQRFAQGLSLGGQRVPVYLGEDDDFPDMDHLDLAERQEILEKADQELKNLNSKIQKTKDNANRQIKSADTTGSGSSRTRSNDGGTGKQDGKGDDSNKDAKGSSADV